MVGPNDQAVKDAQARHRRRKSAGWKSGLMLTGLGAVVLGAGYLAGANAPATAQNMPPETAAQPGTGSSTSADETLRFSDSSNGSNASLFLGYDEEGRAVFLGNDGRLAYRSDDSFDEHDSDSDDEFVRQFDSQRNRQPGGFSQQQPNFRAPTTRSRGS